MIIVVIVETLLSTILQFLWWNSWIDVYNDHDHLGDWKEKNLNKPFIHRHTQRERHTQIRIFQSEKKLDNFV